VALEAVGIMARKLKDGGRGGTPLLLLVASIALLVSRRHLSRYGALKSRHTFTQPQLMACLVLKAYLKQSYRGVVEVLQCSDRLREALGLSDRVPVFQTLKEFEKRVVTPELTDAVVGQVLQLVRERGGPRARVEELAVDSTGLESTPASVHFVARSGRRRRGYVKLMVAVSCTSLLAVAAVASVGPSNDGVEAPSLLWKAAARCSPHSAYFDSGFDSERNHAFCRDGWGVASFIPPVPKTPDGSVRTRHRARCVRLPASYGKRWHVESFISGMKRSTGSTLSARSVRSLLNEAMLKLLAYAIRR
jgi:hypothetical protein